jgi:S1-C subfamily serine protease
MSNFDYSQGGPRHFPARPAPVVLWPVLVFVGVLVLLVGLGLFAWWKWPFSSTGLDPSGQPREVTPRTMAFKDEADLEALYEKALPSVVHINNLTDQSDSFNVQKVPQGSGSGFVWDKQGHIVTNYHVVEGASAVEVVLSDRSSYTARQAWVYPDKDLAVLTIDAPESKLVPIPLGTSHDLKVGQKAVVIGNPFGLDGTLTNGIISALGREIESRSGHPIQGVIQTSAPINPGNSGGPLLDSEGRLIGVTTAILSPSGTFAGIGFAIPADEVNRVVPQLIAHGKVVRPRLGVQLAEDQQAQKQAVEEGALILRVMPETPAARAGLRGTQTRGARRYLGDVITAINDRPIKSGADYFAAMDTFNVGDTITIAFLRDHQKHEVQVKLDAVQ